MTDEEAIRRAGALWPAFCRIVFSYPFIMGALQGLLAVGVIAICARP